MSMTEDATPQSNFIVQPLARVYAASDPYVLALFRVITGLWLLPHGLPKLADPSGPAEFFASLGYHPGWFWVWVVIVTEVVLGLMLAAGFLTRLAAFIIFIHLLNVVAYHWNNGFLWPDGGWEYPGLWAAAALLFVVRGGGRLSVDRAIGREI